MTQPVMIKDVLLQCQDGMQCHTKLLKVLKKIYNTMGVDAFWEEFEPLIKFPMVVYQREPTVERTIDFIAKFATSLFSKPAPGAPNEEADTESDANPLLQKLFDFLLQHYSAKDRAVRFRVCQLVTKLLSNLGEEATIDDELYERVFHCMLERLRDKTALVRVHAALALVRLQDPTDDTCPVIKAYIFLMTSDPNPEVRKMIVSRIAPCRKTLPVILARIRDVKDTVRQAAFAVIADKVPMKAMSISQRVDLVKQGLNDRAECVRTVCSNKLLQSWLRGFEGNVLDLLHSLDVEDSPEVCRDILSHLFKDSPIADLIANFNLLDDNCVIPQNKLTCESALYWQELCRHVHKAGTSYEEHLDMVLPACLNFCTYLDGMVSELAQTHDVDRQLELEFIIQQLLQLFSCMDLSDQACRKAVQNLLHKMLLSDHVSFTLVEHILPCLRSLHATNDSLITYIAETVAEIREPITTVEKGITPEEQRKIDLKVAKVRVELNQVREELDTCVKNQEFQRAAELKESIQSLEMERSNMLSYAEPSVEEIKTEKNDARTVMKCLTIICQMLEVLPLQTLTPTLQMLVETQILPGMSNEEALVRKLAVTAIGICCQLKQDIIKLHLPILMQASQVDVESVRLAAVKSLFDLIHIYGLGAFQDPAETDGANDDNGNENDGDENEESKDLLDATKESELFGSQEGEESKDELESQSGWSKTASNLIAILSSALDNETGDLRAVVAEGLVKLLMSRRVFSAGLLSRLLLLWYNPLAEDDSVLRHTLGTFFPIFAFSDSANQELTEEAFLPTLRTIVNAPTTSPLNSVNASSVADFLVELTHAQRLVSSQNTEVKDNPCHDNIAVKVCNEILSNPQSFQLRLWTRILNQLGPSPDNQSHLKDLSVLCQQMLEAVKEKTSVKALEKFQKTVSDLLLAADMATLSVTEGVDGNKTEAENKTQADQEVGGTGDVGSNPAAKTPSMPPPAGPTGKSTGRRVHSKRLNSRLDCTVWSTQSQREMLDKTAEDSSLESIKSNMESLLLDTSKTPSSKVNRTPGSKRALHTIQDPSFQ